MLSKEQREKLRIMQAIMVAVKYRGLRMKHLLKGLNTDFVKSIDMYKKFEIPEWTLDELHKTGSAQLGMFKIRKAKKCYVITPDWTWRIRLIDVDKRISGEKHGRMGKRN